MTRLSILTLFLFFITACSSTKKSVQNSATENQNLIIESTCRKNWVYFDLKDTTYGQVLLHAKAMALCGHFAFASLTLIKLQNSDTIRVLELCNATKDFKLNDTVKVTPQNKPPFGVTLPLILEQGVNNHVYYIDPKDCNILKTCYGSITLSK